MNRFAGIGQTTDRYHYPPPPAASSSTLSPLAPPFTVDRYVPAVANPNPNPNPNPNQIPPTAAMSPYFVPKCESLWSSSSSGVGTLESTRYYPYKGYVGGWSGAFDMEDSLESCQMLKKRGTVDSLNSYEDSFGSWHGAHNGSSLTLGHVGSESSEWLDDTHQKIYVNKHRAPIDGSFPAELDTTVWPNEGSSYFYSPETTSVVKECDTFIPSSYDRYISELISSSRDQEVHYPAQTSSRHEYVPSNERTESVLSCVLKHGNSLIKHANLYRNNDDYADYLIGVKNKSGMYDNTEGNEGLENMGISGDPMQRNRGILDPYLQTKGLPLGNSSDLGQSIDCLPDVKFGFNVADLSCCNASNFERASFTLDDSMQTTQEILDHQNVAVDSPCWKGASVSRQHPFSSNEIVQPVVISVTSGSDDLVLGQRSLKIQSDIEQDGIAVCYENGKNIDSSTVTDMSGSDLKFQDCVEGESNPAKVDNTKEIEQHDIRGEHISVLNEISAPQGIDDHVRQLSQVENIICKDGLNTSQTIATVQNSDFVFNHKSTSPNCFSSSNTDANKGEMNLSSLNIIFPAKLKNPVSSDAPSKCLSQEQDTHVLIKAMLSLSDVLLCHNCNDKGALEEFELKPVQQIIDNLEALILRNKKSITGSSSRISRVEEIQPEIKDSNAEMSSDEASTDAKENKNVKHDNIVKSFTTSFKLSDAMSQEEDPKILLYKNLWVQTEATLCSLKHDVALLKLEMGSLKHRFEAKSQVSSNGLAEPVKDHDGLNCATSISEENPNTSNTQVEKSFKQSMPKDDEIDTSVLARYRILKGRDKVVLSASNVDKDEIGEKKEVSPKLASDVNTFEKGALKQNCFSKLAVVSPKKNMEGEKLPALNQRMELTESHLSASDGSVIQSYNSRSHGKWLFSSGSGSPSSEWEHVLKDEFIW